MGETNSPSVAHVGYDISPLSRVKFKILATRLTYTIQPSTTYLKFNYKILYIHLVFLPTASHYIKGKLANI
jgi:hypothetical protein